MNSDSATDAVVPASKQERQRQRRWRLLFFPLLIVSLLLGCLLGRYFFAPGLPAVPAVPIIKTAPPNPTSSISARFTYADSTPGVRFRCSLDESRFLSCHSSGISYAHLRLGPHRFMVEVVTPAGTHAATAYFWRIRPWAGTGFSTHSLPGGFQGESDYSAVLYATGLAPFTWTIVGGVLPDGLHLNQSTGIISGNIAWDATTETLTIKVTGSNGSSSTETLTIVIQPTSKPSTGAGTGTGIVGPGLHYTISGNAPQLFYPGGTPQQLDLIFTNGNAQPVIVKSVTVTITSAGASCPVSNFKVVQDFTPPTSVTVPAKSQETLTELGVPAVYWPGIDMVNTSTNQNGCEGVRLTLHYEGR